MKIRHRSALLQGRGMRGALKLLLEREDVSTEKLYQHACAPLRLASLTEHDGVVKLLLGRKISTPTFPMMVVSPQHHSPPLPETTGMHLTSAPPMTHPNNPPVSSSPPDNFYPPWIVRQPSRSSLRFSLQATTPAVEDGILLPTSL
jgi:hypothetical protein